MVTPPPTSFSNGRAPLEWFRSIKDGRYSDGTPWHTLVLPYPLDFHNRLVARAKRRTGRTLQVSDGYGAYRPIADQIRAKAIYGNGAATVGTSSHGLIWEGGYVFAFDYSNWDSVYNGFGGRAAFYEDVRAEGGYPGLISPARGYPDEPWHVVLRDPFRAGVFTGSAAGGSGVPFDPTKEDDLMSALSDDQQRQMYDALVVNGGQYYKTDAIVNVLRDEIAVAVASVAAGGIMFPGAGYLAFPAIANAIYGLSGDIAKIDGADVDEAALAASLAPLITANVGTLPDDAFTKLAKATADEIDRRDRARLNATP